MSSSSRPTSGLLAGAFAVALGAGACAPEAPAPEVKDMPRADFVERTFATKTGPMPYRLYTPARYDARQRYPLILWLHGAGGSGTDNVQQITGDQIPGTHSWITPERQSAHPAFVFVPQTNIGWVAKTDSPELGPTLDGVMQILDALSSEFSIDLHRVYALGQSMGGGGVWNLITNKPDRFAAAIIVCPVPADLTRAANVAHMPIWLFQGDQDSEGFLKGARATVEALKKAGGHPRYTEYAGLGHEIWTRVFDEPELVPWLFSQSR